MTLTDTRPPDTDTARVPRLDSDAALRVASELAIGFAGEAAGRDAERWLPAAEVERLSASGLLAVTVPAAHGGAGLPVEVVTEVFRLLATGDPNLAQIPHSHFVHVNAVRHRGSPSQQAFLFEEVLRGRRFGNAQSEVGSRHVRDHATTLHPDGPGRWLLRGVKGYCTGALFADWIPVLAHLGVDGPLHVAWVGRHDPGVTVIDDWDGVGQRTTASGTVRLDDVPVADDRVMPYHLTFDGPQTYGAFAQVLHAAIDAGIARAALAEASDFVTTRSRPYPDAGVERAADDPLVVQAFGEMELQVRAADALLAEAARSVDRADAALTRESAAEASLNLDRHWRNARTHTLHDPTAWKVQHLGRYAVDGTLPPNHGQL